MKKNTEIGMGIVLGILLAATPLSSRFLREKTESIGLIERVARLEVASALPGSVMAYAGPIPGKEQLSDWETRKGWMVCDGRPLRRFEYPELFDAIGTAHGNGTADGDGNKSTGEEYDFNLPDFRGMFLRGVDGIAGRDPDNAGRTALRPGSHSGNRVGSIQQDAVGGHEHLIFIEGNGGTNQRHGVLRGGHGGNHDGHDRYTDDGRLTGTAAETRPKNI